MSDIWWRPLSLTSKHNKEVISFLVEDVFHTAFISWFPFTLRLVIMITQSIFLATLEANPKQQQHISRLFSFCIYTILLLLSAEASSTGAIPTDQLAVLPTTRFVHSLLRVS